MGRLKAIVLTKNELGQLQVRADYDKEIASRTIGFSEDVGEVLDMSEMAILSEKWTMVEALTEEL